MGRCMDHSQVGATVPLPTEAGETRAQKTGSRTYQEAEGDDLQDTFQGKHHGEGDVQVLQGQLVRAGRRVVLPGREKRRERTKPSG